MTKYLGCLAGTGQLQAADVASQRVGYEIDGFRAHNGQISASGEISLLSGAFDRFVGQAGLVLLTDDGRKLKLTFSDPKISGLQAAAHVDVLDGAPGPAGWTH
jgi:hypothetical protein